MQETQKTWVQSLRQEDPLEEDLVGYREAWWAIVHGVTKESDTT